MNESTVVVEDLLKQAADIIKTGSLNLDISFHTNIINEPKWIVRIEPPALPWEGIKRCGVELDKVLSEVIEAVKVRWTFKDDFTTNT